MSAPPRARPRAHAVVRVAIAAACIAGCGAPSLEQQLTDYHAQVGAALGRETEPPPAVPEAAKLPSRRDRRLEAPTHRIGGFDFLAIQGCRLSESVGVRNSPIGRVMVPSQRLVYELTVVEQAGECIAALSEERAARLHEVIEQKRSELPLHVWNAIWVSEEMEAYLGAMSHPLAGKSADAGTAGVRHALEILRRPLRGTAEGEALEHAIGGLRNAPPAGRLLWDMRHVTSHLDAVAALLEPRSPTGCRGDEVRLRRVFEKTYMPLQTRITALDRGAAASLESLAELFDASAGALPEVPSAMLRYREQQLGVLRPDGAWQRYRRALVRHAAAWEPTLRLCGVLPAANE